METGGRRGALVIVDNVVRGGDVLDADTDRADVRGTRAFFGRLSATPGVSATALQTVLAGKTLSAGTDVVPPPPAPAPSSRSSKKSE